MDEYQQIIDDILAVLSSERDPSPEDMERLNRRYTEVVQETNRRLRQCDAHLSRGYRSEALQECNRDPNLLELTALLDFPEASVWRDYVEQFELQPPPELLVDIAAELNDAYLTDLSLEKLMNQYRMHALARSPLPTRLVLLRQLAEKDTGNPLWEEDIQQFERVRHNEIGNEVAKAIHAKNVNALAALQRELQSPQWRVPPPQSLIKKTATAHHRLRAAEARAELEALEPQLSAAYSELDIAKGRRLRSRWNALTAIAGLSEEDPLMDLAAPALNWLREEDVRSKKQAGFEAAVADLENALEAGKSQMELERLLYTASQYEMDLPPRLARRAQERLHALDVAARRKRWMIGTAVSASVLLAGIVVVWLVRQRMLQTTIRKEAEAVSRLIHDGKLDEADRHLNSLKEKRLAVFESSEIRKLRSDLKAELRKREGRKARLRELLASAQTAAERRTWEGYRRAYAELKKAENLCRSDLEKTQVKEVERDIRRAEQQKQKSVDEAFLKEVDNLVAREAKLSRDDVEGFESLLNEARRLKERPHVSIEIQDNGKLSLLMSRLEGKHKEARLHRRRAKALKKITSSVGNPIAFAQALQAYVDEFPGEVTSDSFKSVLHGQSAEWVVVLKWNRLVANWSGRNLLSITPSTASRDVKTITEFLLKADKFPQFKSPLTPIVQYLKSVQQRTDATGKPIVDDFRIILDDDRIVDIRMIQTKSGKRYYFGRNDKPVFNNTSYILKYYKNLRLEKFAASTVIPVNRIDSSVTGSKKEWAAPQSVWSQSARAALMMLPQNGWEATFVSILKNLYNSEIDPLLKLQLARATISTASRGSNVFRAVFASHLRIIDDAGVDTTANWIDPDDSTAQGERRKARVALRKLRVTEAETRKLQSQLAAFKKINLGPQYRWVGWLHRDVDDRWACSTGKLRSDHQSGSLVVLQTNEKGKSLDFQMIGSWENDRPSLTASTSAFVEGRPVFLRVVPSAEMR